MVPPCWTWMCKYREIVAICDANPTFATEWFSSNFAIDQVTADYHELLANPHAVEVVYCAVPHNLHEQLYIDILRAGKHLLAEKPFGIDLGACERIIREVDAHPDLLGRGVPPNSPSCQERAGSSR